MAYKSLRSRTVVAVLNGAPDISPGNWAATMDSSVINVNLSFFELYHLVLSNGPAGSTLNWYVNHIPYDSTPHGDINSWDANQALELTPSDTLQFVWNKSTGTAPSVTAYFRYDPFAQV